MITEDEFIAKVEEEVLPVLEEHNSLRKKLLIQRNVALFFAVCADIIRLIARATSKRSSGSLGPMFCAKVMAHFSESYKTTR